MSDMPTIVQLVDRLLFPPILSFRRDSSGTSNGIIPCDCGGFIPTHDSWNEVCAEVEKFYSAVSERDIQEHNDATWNRAFSEDIPKHGTGPGTVYVIRGGDGLTKIGMTRSADTRIKTLIKNHDGTLLHKIHVEKPEEVEYKLHGRFMSKLKRGEWFDLSDADIDTIRREYPA